MQYVKDAGRAQKMFSEPLHRGAESFKSSARGRTTHGQELVKEIVIIPFHTQQMVIVRIMWKADLRSVLDIGLARGFLGSDV